MMLGIRKVVADMPGESIAEYGIAFFAVAGLIYLFSQVISMWSKKAIKQR